MTSVGKGKIVPILRGEDRNPLGSVVEILFTDDVIAIKDGSGFVPADCHSDSLGYSNSDKVSYCRPSVIVRNLIL